MIKGPVCCACVHYGHDNHSCPAYPDGIPDDVLFLRKRSDKDCGNEVGFKDRFKDNK